jgi:hypothetical protein
MDRSERKAAVSAYKERKAIAGVYAIRCAATDVQWVGTAPDLHDLDPPHLRAAAGHRDEPGASVRLERSWARKFRLQYPRRDRSRATDLRTRARAQGAHCALARGAGRASNLTCQQRELARGACEAAVAPKAWMAGSSQVKPGHDKCKLGLIALALTVARRLAGAPRSWPGLTRYPRRVVSITIQIWLDWRLWALAGANRFSEAKWMSFFFSD